MVIFSNLETTITKTDMYGVDYSLYHSVISLRFLQANSEY
jgi:hypothetical protein